MKRHPALVHFSHEHHIALVLANRACLAKGDKEQTNALMETFEAWWNEKIHPHFIEEERALLPYMEALSQTDLCQQILQQHQQLRVMAQRIIDGDGSLLPQWGEMLKQHVRFEEHTFFPQAEKILSEEQLATLQH